MRVGFFLLGRIVSVVSRPMVCGNVSRMRSFVPALSFALRRDDLSESLAASRLTATRLDLNGQPRPVQLIRSSSRDGRGVRTDRR